jgi:hypothetical protein
LRTSQSSEHDPPSATLGTRVRASIRVLDPEQRLAALAAFGLGASLFLPWWRDPLLGITYVGVRRLTFIELALLVLSGATLFLLFERGQGRAFHLPLSDGTLIAASGGWAFFLVLFRMLDPPSRTIGDKTTDYGIRWGILIALASAAILAVAGARDRRKRHRGEPEAVAADADATPTLPLKS